MGSRVSRSDGDNDYTSQLNNIHEDDLDLSRMDRSQVNLVKGMTKD